MRPQDIVILLKILCYGRDKWYSKDLARDLSLSSAEVSNSLARSAGSGLIDTEKLKIRAESLYEFLVHGIQYVFPQRPGTMVRGMPTAHSHPAMSRQFVSDQLYVWPDAASDVKGFAIAPLYAGEVAAAKKDERLYLLLALVDMLRVGKTRERKAAMTELKKIMEL